MTSSTDACATFWGTILLCAGRAGAAAGVGACAAAGAADSGGDGSLNLLAGGAGEMRTWQGSMSETEGFTGPCTPNI